MNDMVSKLVNGSVGEDKETFKNILSEEALDAMIKMEEEKVEEEELENLINEAEEADEEAEEAVEVSDRLENFADIINEYGLSKPLVLAMDPDGSLRRNNLLPEVSNLSNVNVRDELSQEVYMGVGDVAKKIWEGIKNIWKKIWGFIKKIGSGIATLFRGGKTKAAYILDKLDKKDEVDEEKLDKKDLKVYEHWFKESPTDALVRLSKLKDSVILALGNASNDIYEKIKEIGKYPERGDSLFVEGLNKKTNVILVELGFSGGTDGKYKFDDGLKKALGWDEAILTTTTTSIKAYKDGMDDIDLITNATFSPKDKSQETKTMKLKDLCSSKNKAIDHVTAAMVFFKKQKLIENALNSLAKSLDDSSRLGDHLQKQEKLQNRVPMGSVKVTNALFGILRKIVLRNLAIGNKVSHQRLNIASAFVKCMK